MTFAVTPTAPTTSCVRFYVCPIYENTIYAPGKKSLACCGVYLMPLEDEEPDKARNFGRAHRERVVRLARSPHALRPLRKLYHLRHDGWRHAQEAIPPTKRRRRASA